jgi:polyisoprenoid-binding protein YceI
MTIARAVLLLSMLGAPLAAQSPAESVISDGLVQQGTLSFDGRATTGDFTGTTTTVTGELHGGHLTEVRGWVEAPVRTLVTGNGKRDRDLNKSMESDKYPTIRFELIGVDAPGARGDSIAVSLHGRFIIHGVTRDATFPATVAFHAEGIRVRAQTPLNLKDYHIGGLTKMLGMLKMHEEIVVHVDLMFGSTPPAQQAASLPRRMKQAQPL